MKTSSNLRAARRRLQKLARRERRPGDGLPMDCSNADRGRKRRFCRLYDVSGKRYRALEHRAKRNASRGGQND